MSAFSRRTLSASLVASSACLRRRRFHSDCQRSLRLQSCKLNESRPRCDSSSSRPAIGVSVAAALSAALVASWPVKLSLAEPAVKQEDDKPNTGADIEVEKSASRTDVVDAERAASPFASEVRQDTVQKTTPSVPKACRSSAHVLPENPPPPATEEQVREKLEGSRVLLFMKGCPERPRCRFSRAVCELLRKEGVQFDHVDVLDDDPEFREAMKAHWPTFPQLWVEGILLGGADAVRALAERGEFLDALNSATVRERASLTLLLNSLPTVAR